MCMKIFVIFQSVQTLLIAPYTVRQVCKRLKLASNLVKVLIHHHLFPILYELSND